MTCPNCKTSNADNAHICSECGAGLRDHGAFVSPTAIQEEEITRHQSERAAQEATLVDREGDLLLGSTIAGKYRIDVKLGAGGMGTVYRATRLLIGDDVAIKILHSEQSDPRAAERFRLEAQAAARLKHPNAVTIYDFGVTDDGLQYLVMEYVEGQSLRQIIKEQGSLTPLATAEIINQACAALGEAHRHNIIHRDVKPDNIIVDVTAYGLRVKVLDFGIAKLRDVAAHNLTQTGGILGTPHYMSPEQCLGEELDGRSDIYSLGIVLYEMLTGAVPFNSPVSTAIVVQHVNQPPPSLCSHNVKISPAVEIVVLRSLEKQQEARPQTAGELAREFNTAVNNGATIPTGPPVAMLRTSIDTPLPFEAVISMPATTLLKKPPKNREPATQGLPSRTLKFTHIATVLAFLALGGGGVWFAKHRTTNQAGSNDKTELIKNAADAPKAISVNFSKNFAGLVGGKFKIEMKLQRNGGELSGTYFYQPANDLVLHGNPTRDPERWADKDISSSRIDAPIKGTVDDQQNFSIEEFDTKGAQVGTFRGRFTSETEIEGTWSKPNGKSPTPFSLKDEGEAAKGGNYVVLSKVIIRKTGGIKIHMNYPQLEGLSDENAQRDFNERVRALVNKDAAGFANEEGGTHDGGFSVDYRSAGLLSVVFVAYNEWPMAAHGMQYNFSYNYDLKHDRALELQDLFLPGVNHLSVISKLCAKGIATQKRKNGFQDIYEDGEAAAYEALKEDATFYLGETGLVFIFDPYQVGSYAEGYYVVSIPYSQLRGIINPNGPLAPFVS